MQKTHRKGLLWCFATLASVTVVGSSRVNVRYNRITHAEKTQLA